MPLALDVITSNTEKLGVIYTPRLSAFMMDAIKRKAAEIYPLPDQRQYEQPLPDAVIEGDVIPAIKNPEYLKLVNKVMQQRNRYFQYAVLNTVRIEGCTHEEVIAFFRDILESMRQFAEIPDGDEFAVTMHYCVLTPAEYLEIINNATKEQALSQGEVRDGLRIFRRNLSGSTTRGDRREEGTSDLSEGEQVQAQQPAG